MIDKVNFKGFVYLSPKVEKAIMEKEYYALVKNFKDSEYDVYVKNRDIISSNENKTKTFFECYSIPNNKCLSTLVTTPKLY